YEQELAPSTVHAARVADNAIAFALAAPTPRTRAVKLPNGQPLNIPDLPELASIEVLQVGAPAVTTTALATTEAADVTVNVYAITPFQVPADAPVGFQPEAGMRPVAVEFEIKNNRPGFLKVYPTSASLVDASGVEYGVSASLLAAYEAYKCNCEADV